MNNKHKVPVLLLLGIAIVIIGIAFLIDRIFVIPIMARYWPLAFVLLSLPFIIGVLSNRKAIAILAVPGSLLSMLGLILLFQNLFNAWNTWAYIWTLFFVALGLGLLILGCVSKNRALYPWASGFIGFGLISFVLLGAFFEEVFNLSGDNLAPSYLWGSAVIGLGLYLIFAICLFETQKISASEADSFPVPETDLPDEHLFEESDGSEIVETGSQVEPDILIEESDQTE